MIKLIKNIILVYLISLIVLIFASLKQGIFMVYLLFAFIYAPIGGILLSLLDYKFRFSKKIFYLVALGLTIFSMFISIFIIGSMG